MSGAFDSSFMPQRRSLSRAMRTRQLIATPQALWQVVEDPFAMTRWWPNVARVEMPIRPGGLPHPGAVIR